MVRLFLFSILLTFSSHVFGFKKELRQIPMAEVDMTLNTGQYLPDEGEPVADVLFLHGFGDRFSNHEPLFEELTRQKLRVVSFDFPSHGDTTGEESDINDFDFTTLGDLASVVEHAYRQEFHRPLVLMGWSTGGLLAVRIAQSEGYPIERALSGVVLLAPAVSVRLLVGKYGVVTEETLSNNDDLPHEGQITPWSPLIKPIFSMKLLWNAAYSQWQDYPADLPTLVILADDDQDVYVKSRRIRSWVKQQRTDNSSVILGVQCTGAKHELDNEPNPVGEQVRKLAARFARSAADLNLSEMLAPKSPCSKF